MVSPPLRVWSWVNSCYHHTGLFRRVHPLPQTFIPWHIYWWNHDMDYSLFMVVMMVLMSERVEKRLRATLAAFPPSNLCWNNLYFCFLCFSTTPYQEHRGSLYIGVFRSSSVLGEEDGWHQSSRAQTSLGGAVWSWAHTTRSRLTSGAHLVDLFCYRWFSWYNINTRKIPDQFEFWKVPDM
jgi:hypothetical protein